MLDIQQPLTLLGNISPADFLKNYWQKKPLLIKQAIPNFKSPISAAELKKLAKQDNVESRLIYQEKGQWNLESGPFNRTPKNDENLWSLLVQSVDLHHDAIADLLQKFRFLPDARLDDAMISLANNGGGVGPHFDSYDVFLFQGMGQRQWSISQQKDLSLVPNLPCKILQNFVLEEQYVLEPGDMLYLPPHVAHDGIAVGDNCMTISFGFRTPSLAVLARGMLEAAAEQISANAGMGSGPFSEPALPTPDLSAMYKDPDALATTTPALIPEKMLVESINAVKQIQFDEALAQRFLGCWLSEPNQLAIFDASEDCPDLFEELPESGFIALDRKTRMLYRMQEMYLNGEVLPFENNDFWTALANDRKVKATELAHITEAELEFIQNALDDGWMHFQA